MNVVDFGIDEGLILVGNWRNLNIGENIFVLVYYF